MAFYRTTCVLFAAFILFSSSIGFADTVTINFCFEYDYEYGDTGRGDYYIDNTNDFPDAKGIYMELYKKGLIFKHKIAYGFTGSSTGCKSFDLDSTEEYSVKLIAKAIIDNNNVNYVKDSYEYTPFIHHQWVSDDVTYTQSGTATYRYDWYETYQTSNILAAGMKSINRRPAGVSGHSTTFWTDECDSGAPGCHTDHGLVIGDAGLNRRFLIAHEIGHELFNARNNEQGHTNNCSHYTSYPDCGTDTGSTSHGWHTREYASCAVYEGWANFYSATVWNDKTENSCHYKDEDCYNDSKHFENECAVTPMDSYGVEGDWTNFWWDIHSDEDILMSVADTLAILIDTDPEDWDVNGEDEVYENIFAAAMDEAYDITVQEWTGWADYNGINW